MPKLKDFYKYLDDDNSAQYKPKKSSKKSKPKDTEDKRK